MAEQGRGDATTVSRGTDGRAGARAVWRRALLKALALGVGAGWGRRSPVRAGGALLARGGGWAAAAPVGSAAPSAYVRGGRSQAFGLRSASVDVGRGLRVLVIRPDHLGDLLLTTPALGLLREGLPEAEITALVGPWARPALAGRREVDAVRTCAFPGFTREASGSPLAPYWQLLAEARRLRWVRYDAALVLRVDHWWGAALAAAAGIPLRVGYGVPESRDFLTHALPPDFAQHSVRESWRVVAALLGLLGRPVPAGEPPPVRTEPSAAGCAAAAALLAAHGIADDVPLVAVHPGTGADVKRWPSAWWGVVADALAERLGARVVVTGSEAERALAGEVAGAMRESAVVAAGVLDWDGLAGLFARCALVVGVDSGPLHLAAALDVPSVAIFGPTAPGRFGPWADPRRHAVVRAGLACSPCGNLIAPPCGARVEPACMQAVGPDAVLAAAMRVVGAAEACGDEGPSLMGGAGEGRAGEGERRAGVDEAQGEPGTASAAAATVAAGQAGAGGQAAGQAGAAGEAAGGKAAGGQAGAGGGATELLPPARGARA